MGGVTGIFDNFLVLDLDVLVPLQVFASPSEVIVESEPSIDARKGRLTTTLNNYTKPLH